MSDLLKKLQFKDYKSALILNNPVEFKTLISEIKNFCTLSLKVETKVKYDFIIIFVKSCNHIKIETSIILNNLENDANLWFAYPKKSSKKYTSDISRESGWQPLGDAGFEGVRQIALNDDWSALRFRKTEFIKSFKRDKKRAMSQKGKNRID